MEAVVARVCSNAAKEIEMVGEGAGAGSIVYKVFPQSLLGQIMRYFKKWSFFVREWSFLFCVVSDVLYVHMEYF